MKNVLTIGSGTQDIFIENKSTKHISLTLKNEAREYSLFESGEKIEVKNVLYFTGGGSTNSSTSFKRLGFNSSCFCIIGNDIAGKMIIDDLKKEKVNTKNIITSKKYPSGKSYIINSHKGEKTVFAYRGANAFLTKEQIPFPAIKNQKIIYITSLSHNSSKLLPNIAQFAKENNIQVAINPGISQLTRGTLLLKKSLRYIDIFILNSIEAKRFMIALIETDENYKKLLETTRKNRKSCFKKDDCLVENPITYENINFSIYKFFRETLKMGPKIVAVTNGENGVYVCTKKEILFHPSIKTKLIDSVGAGDSFGSCFVATLNLNYSIEDALRFGVINSSSVISEKGAKKGLLTISKLEKRKKSLKKNLLKRYRL